MDLKNEKISIILFGEIILKLFIEENKIWKVKFIFNLNATTRNRKIKG